MIEYVVYTCIHEKNLHTCKKLSKHFLREMSVLRQDVSLGKERKNGLGEMGDNFTCAKTNTKIY
jgi:hypothetical protein